MPKLKKSFIQGKLNTDIDERLLPEGQYPFMENGRVSTAGEGNVGILENYLGNQQLTSFTLTNSVTIGAFADTSNQKIYYFVTSDEKDLVIEYDDLNNETTVLLESSNPNGVLNFNKNYLITGVNKVINGDFTKDILIWTDDLNPPRMVNIERAKTFTPDGFIEDDISVIKSPPVEAPEVQFTFTPSSLEENLRERFVSIAYRYKYLDGEYSALSPFSLYGFAPSEFDLNYQTYENEGMVNAFNALNILFDTGSERVTDIQLVYKETNSTNIYLIETFNKALKGWGDNEQQSYLFYNSKIYMVLPEDELFRSYDNVPLLAKSQELIGNRLCYGNYLEGYNMVDKFGEKIDMDYSVSLQVNSLEGQPLPYTASSVGGTNNHVTLDFTGLVLKKNTRISMQLDMSSIHDGNYDNGTDFILNVDYADASELASSPEFILFIETILGNNFTNSYTITLPADTIVDSITGFQIVSSTATSITISAPEIVLKTDNTPTDLEDDDFTFETVVFTFDPLTEFFFKETAVDSSLKTNRSYEVGIVYADRYNRSSSALTSQYNTLYIPQEYSVFQNKLRITLNHKAPYWADRYRFVVKQNKLDYHIIYALRFYESGLFRYIRLEGDNKNKVNEGDILIVKSDLSGAVSDLIKVKVLEKEPKDTGFLGGQEEAGVYIKVKPENFDLNISSSLLLNYSEYDAQRSGRPNVYMGSSAGTLAGFFNQTTGLYEDYTISGGSTIHLRFNNYESDGYNALYEQTFIVQDDYDNFQEWFETEVDIDGFGGVFSIWFERNPVTNALIMRVEGAESGSRFERSKLQGNIDIQLSQGIVILETEPLDSGVDLFYEDSRTFYLDDINHLGNIQQQDVVAGLPAIFELDIFNCYAMGNGAECIRVKDGFNTKYLNIDYRPTATTLEQYKQVRRYADITYSAVYNENTNVNGLNEFNLYTGNFKEDIAKHYGSIQKLYARDTDLLVFQEDKVSRVLYGKEAVAKADGTSDLVTIPDVLGTQVAYAGEWGISKNPESFAIKGNAIYFTDRKRGTPVRLSLDGNTEINDGMVNWFKDLFKATANSKQVGAFDPYDDQYVLTSGGEGIYPTLYLDCSNAIVRQDFNGTLNIEMDYGTQIGSAGFSYITNGVPVRFTLTWNGITTTTGFVGDTSYNDELAALGLPPVSGAGTGTLMFDKTDIFPPTATIEVYSPFNDARFELYGTCIVTPEVTVVTVVANDSSFEGMQSLNRFKWASGSYASAFNSTLTVFGEGEVSYWNAITGQQGSGFIPPNGSTVRMETSSVFNEPSVFNLGGKFKYLLSDTLYTEEQIEDLLTAATSLESTEINYENGDILHTGSFVLPADFSQQYIYLIWDYRQLVINQDTNIIIYFDASGSMGTTLTPLQTMRDTLLKDALLPAYNNDEDLYNSKVTIVSSWTDERTVNVLNMEGTTPEGNVIVLVFQDEASTVYYSGGVITPRTTQYDTDITEFRNRLNTFPVNYYRGVVFQVNGDATFKSFMQAIDDGTGSYLPPFGLSDRVEVGFKYDVNAGDTPEYYLAQVTSALTELGFEL